MPEPERVTTGRVHPLALAQEQLDRRKRFGELVELLVSAIRLVRRAAGGLLLLNTALSLLQALLLGAQVLTAKLVLEDLLARGGSADGGVSWTPLVLLSLTTAGAGLLGVVQAQRLRLLSERVLRETLQRLMSACSRVDLLSYESPAFYDRLQRVQLNALSRPVQVTQALIGVVTGISTTLVLAVTLLQLAPALLPLLVVAGVPLALLSRRGSRSEFRFSVAQAEQYRERYYLQEVLTSRTAAKEVRAFELGPGLTGRWSRGYDRFLLALTSQVRLRERLGLLSAGLTALVGAGALVLLVLLLDSGTVSLADAGAAAVAARLLNARVASLVGGIGSLYESALFLSDLEDFLTLPSEEAAEGTLPPAAPFTALHLEGVGFRYPQTDRWAVRGVNITIEQGQVVALVGENGSGKTTLAKVLAGLYQPTEGTFRWDGVETRDLDLSSRRQHTAVIFQDYVRYQLPARENIGVGRAGALSDQVAIEEAARQAGIHDYLSALPKGYDTYLSQAFRDGQDLSLGQWQRVALARALHRQASFVILDEPSASLDARAEHTLFANLRTMLAGRTVLFISHRFSTVRGADRILVLKDGRVVEDGDHETLMSLGGVYAELFELQAAAYRDDEADASVPLTS